MSAVTLSLAKAHMKVAGSDEDELIQLYIDAAETWFGNYIGKPLADFDPVPADLKHAVLKLVAFHYDMRSVAAFGLSIEYAPHSVTSVADAYRENWFGEDATDDE